MGERGEAGEVSMLDEYTSTQAKRQAARDTTRQDVYMYQELYIHSEQLFGPTRVSAVEGCSVWGRNK